jgi:hypothetical protein
MTGTSELRDAAVTSAVRVFISFAHDSDEHRNRVRDLWLFLRENGIDTRIDLAAAEAPQDWPMWMTRQIREADFVLVVASPKYKERAEEDAPPGEGRGVRWEARLIREAVYADPDAAQCKFLPVILAGGSTAEIPSWLGPESHTHYAVSESTLAGAEKLLRYLTGQPYEVEPPLGRVPDLAPSNGSGSAAASARGGSITPAALRTEVVLHTTTYSGKVTTKTVVAGTVIGSHQAPVPATLAEVWSALRLPAPVAAERLASAGRDLARMLFNDATQDVVVGLVDRLRPGDGVDVVLEADGASSALPVELLRLPGTGGADLGPICLRAGVTVRRRLIAASGTDPVPLAGPLKILAAVAAPDEASTTSSPLDVEAEMQAVLDCAVPAVHDAAGQVRILEVASADQIDQALTKDAFHVLHLSAHGCAVSVELEDEDGTAQQVTADQLMQVLRHAGRPVPLIVLSTCSGAAGASADAIAAGLIARGADRVIAMQAPVTDGYATSLAAALYAELVRHDTQPVAQALARARYTVQEHLARQHRDDPARLLPEYAVATLLCAGEDAPLTDPTRPAAPLTAITSVPSGASVRELPIGHLIGRRTQLRAAMSVLRRTRAAVDEYGATGGLVLTGIGGIGKTALAGRIITRAREGGWLVAVHEGRWNPTALFTAIAEALTAPASATVTETRPWPGRNDREPEAIAGRLADPSTDDQVKVQHVTRLLSTRRLLLVLDDFEQNLNAGGSAYHDPALGDLLAELADAATTPTGGRLLITCRYPLPQPDPDLANIPVPPLTIAELRRLFLRLPALRDLPADDQRLLIRTIGGHPRLIEFVDALLRRGTTNLPHIRGKLRALAKDQGLSLRHERDLSTAAELALLLGAADILLADLTSALAPIHLAVLHQVSVCRAPMTPHDLAFTLDGQQDATSTVTAIRAVVEELRDLTLLSPGDDIVMPPWTADLITRNAGRDLVPEHRRAETMRLHRFEQGRGTYEDLLDLARHLAAQHRYDDLASLAAQAAQIIPGTLARLAYLGEARPLIPDTERAWILVTDLEVQAFLAAGDLPNARTRLGQIHAQVEARTAADPTNTGWQRDLSVSHERLGDVAVAAGDLAAARTAYQAGLDIAVRLAAADPTNTGWQREAQAMEERLAEVERQQQSRENG